MEPTAMDAFTQEQVQRATHYHRPLYWSLLADAALGLGVLVAFVFSPLRGAIGRGLGSLPWPLFSLALTGIVLGASFLFQLPLSHWRGFVREHRWGFSTQSLTGWLVDRAKGLAVGLVLTSSMLVGFVGLARALPHWWPAVVAPAGAALVFFLTFIAPVVLEPIFNRFSPLADAGLADDLRVLADRAGVPVKAVLVADASRRTWKENAYASGLGKTRRVVVYDTLLRRAEPRQIELIAAHELGHRRLRHMAQGTLLGMAGMVAAVIVLWWLLSSRVVLHAIGATAAGDPRVIPFVLLSATVLELLGLPFETAFSRRWERAADWFSLELIGDLEAFEATHRDLAVTNLIDLDPPRALYLLLFTHPTPPERIALARLWAGTRTG